LRAVEPAKASGFVEKKKPPGVRKGVFTNFGAMAVAKNSLHGPGNESYGLDLTTSERGGDLRRETCDRKEETKRNALLTERKSSEQACRSLGVGGIRQLQGRGKGRCWLVKASCEGIAALSGREKRKKAAPHRASSGIAGVHLRGIISPKIMPLEGLHWEIDLRPFKGRESPTCPFQLLDQPCGPAVGKGKERSYGKNFLRET